MQTLLFTLHPGEREDLLMRLKDPDHHPFIVCLEQSRCKTIACQKSSVGDLELLLHQIQDHPGYLLQIECNYGQAEFC